MGSLRSLLKLTLFFKKHKLLLFLSLFTILLGSVIYVPIPYIIGKVTDDVLVGSKNLKTLYYYISIIFILYILKYFISFISNYLSSKFNNFVSNELRYELVKRIMNLSMEYLESIEKGYLQSRISECSSITTMFSITIVGILINLFDAILSISTMFTINNDLAVTVLIFMPLFFIFVKISNKEYTQNTKKVLEANAVLNGECFEIINGIEDIKILNGKKYSLNKFKEKLDQLVRITLRQNKIMIFLTNSITGINDVGTLLILLVSGILIIKGQFTIGLYTTFSLYSAKIFTCTQFLANVGPSLKQTCLSVERVFEFLEMDDESKGKNENLDKTIDSIELENVSFQYKRSDRKVLKCVNMIMKRGEKILIRGENGTGKSTLIKLLDALYRPNDGRIFINNTDMAIINPDSIRERISIVSQNIFLFRGTVLDNILYGQEEKKREDVEKLISELNLVYYISRLPKGLDTEIIQNSSGISGGQTQVIAFIRAILSEKDIIILDEPISNVDAETRNIILCILKESKFDGILIIISHFLEGLDFIDKTIDLESMNKTLDVLNKQKCSFNV